MKIEKKNVSMVVDGTKTPIVSKLFPFFTLLLYVV